MLTATRVKEEATLRNLLRWIESREMNMTQEGEGEERVRGLSYILDTDTAGG